MRLGLFALLLLAGCDTPHPTMMGAARGETVLNGIRFVVFHDGARAEVLRMGYLPRDRRAGVAALMIRAAQEVSGCRADPGSFRTRIPGDTGEAMVALDC